MFLLKRFFNLIFKNSNPKKCLLFIKYLVTYIKMFIWNHTMDLLFPFYIKKKYIAATVGAD